MIEELKMILDSIGDLSGVALWVVGAFLVYKVVVYLSTAGSIVFISKLLIERVHDWSIKPRVKIIKQELDQVDHMGDLYCISGERPNLMRVLRMVAGKGVRIESNYIHRDSIEWLEDAIREKEERELKAKKETKE